MQKRSTNDDLNTLLLVQQQLGEVTSGGDSLNSVLPDLLVAILEAVGGQDGRIDLFNAPPDSISAVVVKNGRVKTDAADPALQAMIEQLTLPSQFYVEDTLRQENWFAGSFPDSARGSWSALFIPIQVKGSTAGGLTLLKPGQGSFSAESIALAQLHAGQLGLALEVLRLQEFTDTAEKQLQELIKDNHNLAAILVHDLQGPLGNVVTSLEMVEAGLSGQEDAGLDLMMDIAVRSSKHLQSLVDSLMDISRLEAGQEITDRTPVSVAELVSYAMDVEGPVLEQRQVILAGDLAPDLPPVEVNVDILQRVLLNLIDNALKVSKLGQTITIRAFAEDIEQYARISVIDQGPGIPEADRERIFEKYERMNQMSASKGLGLGLAFCKLAVEAHGGQIWVEDAPHGGACFCFTLPFADSLDSTA